jgi:lipopolysaccharide transport system ATP-binding protein
MSSSRLLLSLNNVGVRYRKSLKAFKPSYQWALEDISFELRKGETLGVIGRNGAGKSTLLRLLAGIIDPDCGSIERNTDSVLLLSLQVGFMPHLSGRENAILSGILLGMRQRDIVRSLDEVEAFAELQGKMDQPVRTYSNGMKARLGFSVAKVADPEVLLVDEVLSVGDKLFREKSFIAMRERIESDRSVVLVSHSEEMIRRYCDRAVWIEDGKTEAEGDVDIVLEKYAAYLSEKPTE